MIAYSIDCAARSNLFHKIVVSTDDDQIGAVARRLGAEVPFLRPSYLSDDHANTTEVIVHAIQELQKSVGAISSVCCIYATAPFLRVGDLKQGLDALERGDWHYVFAATGFGYPIQRSFRIDSSGGVEMMQPEYFDSRSQDLPEAMHDAAQFYWGRTNSWLSRARIFDSHSTVVRIPRWRAQDIDTEEDWLRAEIMAGELKAMADIADKEI